MAARLPPGVELYDAASEIVNAYEDSGMRVAFSLSTRDQNHLVYEDDSRFLSTLPSELAERARAQIAARPVELEEYLSACGELHDATAGAQDQYLHKPAQCSLVFGRDADRDQRLRAETRDRTPHTPP